jgi:uncharacterized protein (TIGR02145 family)
MKPKILKLIILILFCTGSTGLDAQTVKDVDGNVYKTDTIGSQIWLKENLKVTKYNDGSAIRLVTDSTVWSKLTTPGYCWYGNNKSKYKDPYGALYNWYTVNSNKLCPTSWHVPSFEEWKVLLYSNGNNIGGKLKEIDFIHWVRPNVDATNETDFTALPSGRRDENGSFNSVGLEGEFWSSSYGIEGISTWTIGLSYEHGGFNLGNMSNTYGLSVRCIKD